MGLGGNNCRNRNRNVTNCYCIPGWSLRKSLIAIVRCIMAYSHVYPPIDMSRRLARIYREMVCINDRYVIRSIYILIWRVLHCWVVQLNGTGSSSFSSSPVHKPCRLSCPRTIIKGLKCRCWRLRNYGQCTHSKVVFSIPVRGLYEWMNRRGAHIQWMMLGRWRGGRMVILATGWFNEINRAGGPDYFCGSIYRWGLPDSVFI